MKRQPCGTNEVSEIRIIPYKSTKKLKRGHKVNRSYSEEYEEAIQQETKESSRIEGWRQHVAGKQRYPIEQTLKEVGSKKIWTFQNLKGYWSISVSTETSRRMDNTQCVQQRPADKMQRNAIQRTIYETGISTYNY